MPTPISLWMKTKGKPQKSKQPPSQLSTSAISIDPPLYWFECRYCAWNTFVNLNDFFPLSLSLSSWFIFRPFGRPFLAEKTTEPPKVTAVLASTLDHSSWIFKTMCTTILAFLLKEGPDFLQSVHWRSQPHSSSESGFLRGEKEGSYDSFPEIQVAHVVWSISLVRMNIRKLNKSRAHRNECSKSIKVGCWLSSSFACFPRNLRVILLERRQKLRNRSTQLDCIPTSLLSSVDLICPFFSITLVVFKEKPH